MKLGAFRFGDTVQAFRHDSRGWHRFEQYADLAALLAAGDPATLSGGIEMEQPSQEQLVMPVLRPGKVIAVGLNYRDHAAEVGAELPHHPTLFSKVQTSLIGPGEAIVMPGVSKRLDWEAELTIVIGKTVRRAQPAAAEEAILGYTILNDISVRDWQGRTTQWFQGKNFDATTPIGPWVVTKDQLDPIGGLEIQTIVNGEIEQSSSTSEMIFSPAQLVSYISQVMTLEPGDMIATGTPAGVGYISRKYLKPGDELITRIEGIGELRNSVVGE